MDEVLLGAVNVAIIGELKKLFPFINGIITLGLSAVIGAVYGFTVGGTIATAIRGAFVCLASSGLLKGTTVIGTAIKEA